MASELPTQGESGLGHLYSNTQESGVERIFWGCNSLAFLECSARHCRLPGIWMDPEAILLSEIFQTKKDKYCVISLTCNGI